MEAFQRNLIKHMLQYFMDKRGFEFEFDKDNEFRFILGNEDFYTKEMTAQELLEVIDQVVRW